MKHKVRASLAVVTLTSAIVAGVGYGTASAGGHSSVRADDAKTAIATANFTAHNTGGSDEDVKGYFRGDATSPADMFLTLRGDITCLHVEGNRAGLLYPVQNPSMPFILQGQYVLISVEDGGKGGTDHMGFTGPAPKAFFNNCSPQFTPLEVTSGDIVVKDGG